MKGEFDSPSKAATDAYREGWIACFQSVEDRDRTLAAFDADVERTLAQYPNGCPILDEHK